MDPSYLLPRARKGPKHRHSRTSWAAQLRQSPGSAAAACVLILLITVILVRSDSSSVYRDARRIGLTFHRRHQQHSLQTAAELRQQEQGYQQWLSTFKASDPAFQDYCMQVLLNSTRFELQGAQHSQDVFLFQNLYKFWPMQGRTGFYIESGANDPFYLSTSLFFDKCLGWDGLCVEPQAKFHESLKANRSCTLVPECISARRETLNMTGEDATARVAAAEGNVTVSCAPLADILHRYAGSARKVVDLWILDVEGYEMTILNATNFNELSVDALLVEDLLQMPKPDALDMRLAEAGFLKYQELAIDSVFVRRGHPAAMDARPLWYPPQHKADVQHYEHMVRESLCDFFSQFWGLTQEEQEKQEKQKEEQRRQERRRRHRHRGHQGHGDDSNSDSRAAPGF